MMQKASKEYKQAMKLPLRNRGYIRARIGVVNSNAQETMIVDESGLAAFSSVHDFINGNVPTQIYATAENNFSKVDGTMYFEPETEPYYNQGLASEELPGAIRVSFNYHESLNTKGLTINFGECYPTRFTIEYDGGIKTYDNDKQIFVTEDVFDDFTYFVIAPISMMNGDGRLRIYEFTVGIANTFTNHQVLEYAFKDYVSPITDSIPSVDMTLTVDNQTLYYSPDNDQSTLAYMAQGQEISVQFGYDVTGHGDIEWIKATKAYLKEWSADDVSARFVAVDIFDYLLNDKYYDGVYNPDGTSLYDLAERVFASAGIGREGYYIDSYLKRVKTRNPIPAVPQSQALQIIANAGRCALLVDRDRRISLVSNFRPPDAYVSVNNKTRYSKVDRLTARDVKDAYAEASEDFTTVDETVLFMPDSGYLNTGYVSESFYRFENGVSRWDGDVPQITIDFESEWTFYGFGINFRNVAPKKFKITTYLQGVVVQEMTVEEPDIEWITSEVFDECDKVIITFLEASKNARIFVDNVFTGDVTDYLLTGTPDLFGSPKATRQNRVKSISVSHYAYSESQEEKRDLRQSDISVTAGETIETVYFTNPVYGLDAVVTEGDATAEIISCSSFFATLKFVSQTEQKIKYSIRGYEYKVNETTFHNQHNNGGEDIYWSNPLIDTVELAVEIEEWLARYYLGDVEYDITWRGDPITDANDAFYLELKDRGTALIKAYQNELRFNGAWSGALKARKMYGVDRT